VRQLMRESGVTQHAVERYLRGQRVHPKTCSALLKALEKLERQKQRK